MVRRSTRRRALRRIALTASAGLAGCLGRLAGPTPAERIGDHRDELGRLEDVSTALSEGYRAVGKYVRTDEGVLGELFVNPGIEEVTPTEPQAVLYDLTRDGRYRPLGLKWFVPTSDYDEPPALFGKRFVGPIDAQAPAVPEHYALHAWLFRENPDGMFALYNPTIDPAPLVGEITSVRDALVDLLLGSGAEERGYRNTEKCIATDDGGYGVPFVRREADGGGGTDPMDPPILLYRITSSWSYRLLGAEWYVPVDGADGPPTMFGQRFHGPADGHSPRTDQPRHHGLHAWLFRANPDGMFEPFNPSVTC